MAPSSNLGFLSADIRFSLEDAPIKERQFVFSEAEQLEQSLRQLASAKAPSFMPEQARILIVEDEKKVQGRLVQEVFDALQKSSNPLAHQITREQIHAVASEPEGIQWVEQNEPQFVWADFVIKHGGVIR